jgi:hypothetical protein
VAWILLKKLAARVSNSLEEEKMRGKGLFAGALVLSFVILGPWKAVAKPPDRSAKCQSKKVSAASIFVKKLFYEEAASLQNENYNRDQAVEDAKEEFIHRWNEAEATDQCDFPWGAEMDLGGENGVSFANIDELLDWMETRTSAIAYLILDEVNREQIASLNLGAEILRAAGRMAFDLLKAESQFLNKPNQGKLIRARERATRAFEDQYRKRIQHALGANVDVKGLDDDGNGDGKYDLLVEVESDTEKLVEDIVNIFKAPSQ